MTAFGDEATRRRAASLTAVLFDKPFDLDDLRAAVASLLPGADSRASGGAVILSSVPSARAFDRE